MPCRSYSSARSIFTVVISPTRNGRRLVTYTAPSISGASAIERPLATVGPRSSIITFCRVPTFRFKRRAEIFCCVCMNRCQRCSFTWSGTGAAISFDCRAFHRLVLEAPYTIDRSGPSSHSSNISKSASVSPGKPTMKVERKVRSGHCSRQRPMRSRVFSWAAGRRMRFNTSGDAC